MEKNEKNEKSFVSPTTSENTINSNEINLELRMKE